MEVKLNEDDMFGNNGNWLLENSGVDAEDGPRVAVEGDEKFEPGFDNELEGGCAWDKSVDEWGGKFIMDESDALKAPFKGRANLELIAIKWSRLAINCLTLSSKRSFSLFNWCKQERREAMSKCWAWSKIIWAPAVHWRSSNCSNDWGPEFNGFLKITIKWKKNI